MCNTCNDLTKDSAYEFMSSKMSEADVLLSTPARFTVLRGDTDTLSIDILPDDVRSNPYSEYPAKEVLSLMDTFF